MPIRHLVQSGANVLSSSWKVLAITLFSAALAACGEDSSSPAAAAPSPSSGPRPATGLPNASPTIQGTPRAQVEAGQAYDFRPAGTDPDGDILSYFIVNRPSWATFDTATGRLHGTPSTAHQGAWAGIQIGASDGVAQASLPLFAITVGGAPDGAVVVGWSRPAQNTDNSALTDLAGYRVYWGTDPNRLQHSATIRTIAQTNHLVEPLAAGTWYFAVTAFNEQNVESDASPTVVAVVN
jgi:hypothetical protein